jgi:predicted enzyme related to lactoylglutathione lyase
VVFSVPNVRRAWRELTDKGVNVVREPRQVTPAEWAATFADPDGHLLSVFGPEGD